MWILRSKKEMFNLDSIDHVKIIEKNIVFSNEDSTNAIAFDTEAEAQQHFNYIIDGIKGKQGVIHI